MLINLVIDNKNETFVVGDNITTVAQLKQEIQSKFNIQIQWIKYQTIFLMDFNELQSYGIQENSTITIVQQNQQPQINPIPMIIPKLQQYPLNTPNQQNQPIQPISLPPNQQNQPNQPISLPPNQPISIPPNQPTQIKIINQSTQLNSNAQQYPANQIPNNQMNQPNINTNPLTQNISTNQQCNTNNTFSNNNQQYTPIQNINQMNPMNPIYPANTIYPVNQNINYGNNQQFTNQNMNLVNPMNPQNLPMNMFNPQQYSNNFQNQFVGQNQGIQSNQQQSMTTQQINMKKEYDDKISELEKQNKQQKEEIKELKSEIDELKEKLNKQILSENVCFNEKKEQWEKKIFQEQYELKRSKEQLELDNQTLIAKVEEYKNQLQEANLNLIGQNENKQVQGTNYIQLVEGKESTINTQKKQIDDLQNNLFAVQTKLAGKQAECDKQLIQIQQVQKDKQEHEYMQKQLIEKLDQQLKVYKKTIDEYSAKIEYQYLELKKLEIKNSQLQQQNTYNEQKISDQLEQFQNLQKICNQLKDANLKQNSNPQQSKEYLELMKQQEEIINKQKRNEEKKKQDQLNDLKWKQDLKQIQEQEEQLKKKNMKELEKQKKVEIKEKQGTLEICFLLDVTGSMDHYKEQTMKSVKTTVENVKQETNREIKWAVVAYQDYEDLPKLGGSYRSLQFTSNDQQVIKFVDQLNCFGGGDAAEDLAGGIDQMVSSLQWKADYRLAICITDAPCHGIKFNGGVVNDNYKKEDISENLDRMIDKKILFMTIDFTNQTEFMTIKMEEYYKSKNISHLYIKTDMSKAKKENLWQELSKLISQTSILITHTNKQATFSKGQKKDGPGALEAMCSEMCKIPNDPFNFDKVNPQDVIQCKFNIFRIEIKPEMLEKIEDLLLIKDNDYNPISEGQWECVRTTAPFAKGQMKAVYLMKEIKNNHLYVIKTPLKLLKPYSNISEAFKDIKGHLISKVLMAKFMQLVNTKKDQIGFEIPNITYSDFLILQENGQFWIAERFFKGEFVKYNNNFGYINKDDNNVNKLAQAFTYFTYQISGYNYMIADVQGVGNYFTDPAINSNTGEFDETDMGTKGQGQFMVTFEQYKKNISKILKVLQLEDD